MRPITIWQALQEPISERCFYNVPAVAADLMRNHCFCKYRSFGGSSSSKLILKLIPNDSRFFIVLIPTERSPAVLYHSQIRSNINKYFFCNVFTVCWAFRSEIHCALQAGVIGFFHCVVLVSLDPESSVLFGVGHTIDLLKELWPHIAFRWPEKKNSPLRLRVAPETSCIEALNCLFHCPLNRWNLLQFSRLLQRLFHLKRLNSPESVLRFSGTLPQLFSL